MKAIDLHIGQKFGRLTIEDIFLKKRSCGKSERFCHCLCDCGNHINASASHLNSGHTKSCGCYKRELKPQLSHGLAHTKIDSIYKGMKKRCYCKNEKHYSRYGGRGIKICREWLNDKELFFKWAFESGYEEGLTIDRIDNDGDYEPSNCRWVNFKVQANNTSKNHKLTFGGQTHTLSEWEDVVGIKQKTIGYRVNHGWSVEDALTIAPSYRKCHHGRKRNDTT